MKKTLLLISLFLSSQILLAQGRMYWSNLWSSSIGSANLDGSDVKNDFITGLSQPRGIAVDNTNQKIYWINGSANSIGVANLDGTGVNKNFITGLSTPDDIVLDVANQKIYWTNNLTIGRANLDGTGVDQSFITGIPKYASALALDLVGQKIYYTYYAGVVPTPTTGIGKANLDGTGIVHNFVTGIGGSPVSLALDLKNQQIYWVNFYENNPNAVGSNIGKVNMDGTGLNNNYIAGLAYSGGLFLDLNNQNLFYTNYSSPYGITKANLDGSSADQSFITSIGNGPLDLAINETHAYDVIAPSTPQAPTNVSLSPSQGCVGASVAFSGAMTCKTGEAKVWYDANDNVIALPLTTPANTTTYKAACKNLYTSQISSSVPVTYTVVSAPTATASASPTTIGSGTSTTLSLTSNTAVSTYSWKGSNGFSSASASPTPTLSSAVQATVSFSVSITATTGCTATASVEVTVLPLPSTPTNVSLSPSQLCAGNTAAFSGSMTCQNGETKVWYDANDNVITLPLTTPTNTTTYKAACKNTTTNQTSTKVSITFTVFPLPIITASASPTSVYSGSTTQLSVGTNTSVSTYSWKGSNGFSSASASPTPTLSSAVQATVSFTVSITATTSCTATASVEVTVLPLPLAPTNVSLSPSQLCAGNTAAFSGSMTCQNGETKVWYDANDNVITLPLTTPAGTTTYKAACKNNSNNQVGPKEIVVFTVNPLPTLVSKAAPSVVCSGSSTNLSVLSSASLSGYSWVGSNGFSSNEASPSVTLTSGTPKQFSFSVSVTDMNGCTAMSVVTASVSMGVIASASLPTCAGGTLQLYPSTAGVGAHKWAGPSGYATNLASPKIKNMTSERAGVYTVSVTYNNCIVTATVNVTVPQPASTPALSNSSVCVGSAIKFTASGGGASYLWKGPKGFSSSQSNPIINNATTTQKGIYSLTITNNDGCFSTGTVSVEVKQCAGTRLAAEDFVETIELQAFPNPTARQLHIRITLPQASAVQVQLSDMMGKSVGDWKLSDETTTHEVEIDLGNYQQGMYLLRVESGGKFATKKILKAE